MFMKKFLTKENKDVLKWTAFVFVIWRVSLFLVAFLGSWLVPLRSDFLGPSPWSNFDGVHYLNIASRGYGVFEQAFFPFYPFLIRQLAPLFLGKHYLTGMLVSHFSLFLAIFILYKLLRLDFSKNISRRIIIFLLIFPTSFFFGCVYNESLFLALILGSFYSARKNNWPMAGVLGAFASATRLVGIFLFPTLLIEWWDSQVQSSSPKASPPLAEKFKVQRLLSLFLIFFGLGFYMWYLKKTVNDPLYFFHIQPFFGAERTGGKLILIYQVFWRYFKMVMTTKLDPLYFSVWLELATTVMFLGLLVWAYFRKIRVSYLVFAFFAYVTPTLTGTFSSMPRYVIVLFPGFISLALLAEKYRWLKIIYPVLCGILLAFSTILFTRGYWVG